MYFRSVSCILLALLSSTDVSAFRPPAVPLIAKFPYFSIWSEADRLTDDNTRNGLNNAVQALNGMIKVDNNKPLRFMGPDPATLTTPRNSPDPVSVAAMEQLSVDVRPRETIYVFSGEGVELTVTFSTPVFPDDLDTFSLPITYISFNTRSIDNTPHTVSIYFDLTGEVVTFEADGFVTWDREGSTDELIIQRMGKADQAIFQSAADVIDWGFVYLAALNDGDLQTVQQDSAIVRAQFVEDGTIPDEDDDRKPRQANEFDHFPVIATKWTFDVEDTVSTLLADGVCADEITACEANASCEHVLTSGNLCSIPDDIVDGPDMCWQNAGFALNSQGFNTFADVVECILDNQVDVSVLKFLTLGYDDVSAIDYYGTTMQPFWNTLFTDAVDLMTSVVGQFDELTQRMREADDVLLQQLEDIGGENYRDLTSLVFRQAYAATELVFNQEKQKAWLFMKEISSGSFINTVDVIFPFSPIALRDNPALLYVLIEPVLAFANNETFLPYNLEFAPHHLGRWPVCNSGPEEQENMPVEESGNLILMLAGIAKSVGSVEFMEPYLPLLEQWANFLQSQTLDPPLQLTTDDFTGTSAHNAGLAAKGIIALGAYGFINEVAGNLDEAQKWTDIAQDFAQQWIEMAQDGDHFRLTYDTPGSWSLKYNILWQELLGIDVFPDSVIQEELLFYLGQVRNEFGVPLDSRATFTKGDWYSWIAAVADEDQFQEIFDDLHRFADQTATRVPITDWYQTITADRQGFQCRPVMGGLYAKILLEEGIPEINADQFASAAGSSTAAAYVVVGVIVALIAVMILSFAAFKTATKKKKKDTPESQVEVSFFTAQISQD